MPAVRRVPFISWHAAGPRPYLAKCVASSETVAYDDLGTEALRRIDVVDFPVFVGVDVRGRDVYDLV